MNDFETSTIVGGQGDIHLTGLPFAPGAEVEVVVSAKAVAASSAANGPQRTSNLLAALDRAHNTDSVGALRREDLYDRDVLR